MWQPCLKTSWIQASASFVVLCIPLWFGLHVFGAQSGLVFGYGAEIRNRLSTSLDVLEPVTQLASTDFPSEDRSDRRTYCFGASHDKRGLWRRVCSRNPDCVYDKVLID
jgi:hypothetical protein